MEELLGVLDTHAGLLRALTETVTAMAVTLSPEQAAVVYQRLTIARQLALEQDEICPKGLLSTQSRDAALEAYCELLRQRAGANG